MYIDYKGKCHIRVKIRDKVGFKVWNEYTNGEEFQSFLFNQDVGLLELKIMSLFSLPIQKGLQGPSMKTAHAQFLGSDYRRYVCMKCSWINLLLWFPYYLSGLCKSADCNILLVWKLYYHHQIFLFQIQRSIPS